MERDVHARFLKYREAFEYFALKDAVILGADAFVAADAEQRALEKNPARSDEEEQRLADLSALLFRD